MQRSHHPPTAPAPQPQPDRLSAENVRLRRENQALSRKLAQVQGVARTVVDEPTYHDIKDVKNGLPRNL